MTTTNPIDVAIGARVRARRMALSMSQETLGNAMRITYQQVQKYEKGRNRIGGSRMVQIAEALQTTPATLIGGGEPEQNEFAELLAQPGVIPMLRAFSSLTSLQRRAIFLLVRSIKERAGAG